MRKETKNGVTYTFETDDLTSEAVDVDDIAAAHS